jgi:hypothetical protein
MIIQNINYLIEAIVTRAAYKNLNRHLGGLENVSNQSKKSALTGGLIGQGIGLAGGLGLIIKNRPAPEDSGMEKAKIGVTNIAKSTALTAGGGIAGSLIGGRHGYNKELKNYINTTAKETRKSADRIKKEIKLAKRTSNHMSANDILKSDNPSIKQRLKAASLTHRRKINPKAFKNQPNTKDVTPKYKGPISNSKDITIIKS